MYSFTARHMVRNNVRHFMVHNKGTRFIISAPCCMLGVLAAMRIYSYVYEYYDIYYRATFGVIGCDRE